MIYKVTTKERTKNGLRMTRSLDLLYHNKRVRILFIDGTSIEGVVTRFTMYWLEVKLNNGKLVYVNKGSIKLVEPIGEEKKEVSTGGVSYGNIKSGSL